MVHSRPAAGILPCECLRSAGSLQREKTMADEKLRVLAFDTVQLDDGDWDGPAPHGEFLTYTSKHAAASIKVTKNGKTVLDADFGAKKTVMIDDDVIHVPEGAGVEI
jgi:hypothetical protein